MARLASSSRQRGTFGLKLDQDGHVRLDQVPRASGRAYKGQGGTMQGLKRAIIELKDGRILSGIYTAKEALSRQREARKYPLYARSRLENVKPGERL